MMLCAHRKENGLSGDFTGIKGLNMSEAETVTVTFKHYMGTFLLRRARYLSESGHQPPSVDVQNRDSESHALNTFNVKLA